MDNYWTEPQERLCKKLNRKVQVTWPAVPVMSHGAVAHVKRKRGQGLCDQRGDCPLAGRCDMVDATSPDFPF